MKGMKRWYAALLAAVSLLIVGASATVDVSVPWIHSAAYEDGTVSVRLDAPDDGVLMAGVYDAGRFVEVLDRPVSASERTQTVTVPLSRPGTETIRVFLLSEGTYAPLCGAVEAVVPGGTMEYVLNTNTMRLHYPTCASVPIISAKNRQTYYGTRDMALAMGYQPCNDCRP